MRVAMLCGLIAPFGWTVRAQDPDPAVTTRCCEGARILGWAEYNKTFQWTTPLSSARRVAEKERQPLFVVCLAGDLDKEGVSAAANLMRSVIFADSAVADHLSKYFVSTWINLQPGFHRCDTSTEEGALRRAPHGYSSRGCVVLILAPTTEVLHAIPGFLGASEFLDELNFASNLWRASADGARRLNKDAAAIFADRHLERLGGIARRRGALARLETEPAPAEGKTAKERLSARQLREIAAKWLGRHEHHGACVNNLSNTLSARAGFHRRLVERGLETLTDEMAAAIGVSDAFPDSNSDTMFKRAPVLQDELNR
ncbi:MAG TPA: hypothetical protein VI643_06710 [Planctomycetota bacterium]|nr:hypothetical protein [Planctomycetota bacterium]